MLSRWFDSVREKERREEGEERREMGRKEKTVALF